MIFKRHPENPIVTPGIHEGPEWRRCVTFNPAVHRTADGKFYMLERACKELRPFVSVLGLLESDDGVHFELASDEPVLDAKSLGYPTGNVQDPRLVEIGGQYVLIYVLRKDTADCNPTGLGVPDYTRPNLPKGISDYERQVLVASRSGIAVSTDMRNWKHVGWVGPEDLDDRDNILFPEKINGQYAMLRRPMTHVGPEYGCEGPAMWLSYADSLEGPWSEEVLVAKGEGGWEGQKIGGSAPPVRVDEGWLTSYHGVDATSAYCLGFLLLDKNDPTKVLARTSEPVMRPTEYYERVGLVIPNTIFPTGNIVVDDELWVYYGCCDTSIGLATAKITDIMNAMDKV